MFTYATFAAIWIGRYYVIATDYDRYVILKMYSFETSQRKYVHCECLTK